MAEKVIKDGLFNLLNSIDVNDKVEVKNTGNASLSYLSWAWAWAEFKKVVPDAKYEIKTFENNLPYVYDPRTGYMVFTSVTADGITHDMWLPVMDGNNRAMKDEPYQVATKYKTITVQPATMFDINKTIMRCLVKNLAMFGLGLYIYAGEDLPEAVEETIQETKKQPKKYDPSKDESREVKQELMNLCKQYNINLNEFCKQMGINQKSNIQQFTDACRYIRETYEYAVG